VPGIEPGTSGSVARNSDHQTTEAVEYCAYTAGNMKMILLVINVNERSWPLTDAYNMLRYTLN
jgi:hypothetical protein